MWHDVSANNHQADPPPYPQTAPMLCCNVAESKQFWLVMCRDDEYMSNCSAARFMLVDTIIICFQASARHDSRVKLLVALHTMLDSSYSGFITGLISSDSSIRSVVAAD